MVTELISILIPSKQRSHQLDSVIKDLSHLLGNYIELVIGIDTDDYSYDIQALENIDGVKIVRTPSTRYLSNLYNILFEHSCGDIIGYFSDDIQVRLNKEDIFRIRETFRQLGHILYWWTDEIALHGLLTRQSIRKLGFVALPNLEHGYIDHYLTRIFRETGFFIRIDGINPIRHLRNEILRQQPDEPIYHEKSFKKDEEGLTCDERDLLKFNFYIHKYLEIHKNIIISLNNKENQQ